MSDMRQLDPEFYNGRVASVLKVGAARGVPLPWGTIGWSLVGGPLATTQPTEKFYSKPYLGGPNGPFPPGGFAPHLNDGFPGGKSPFGPPQLMVLIKTSQWVGWLPQALLLRVL